MRKLNNLESQKDSPQLKSSGVSLTNGFPRKFAGSAQVAAVSVFGVFLSNLASHRMPHVQFRGLESSRLKSIKRVSLNSSFLGVLDD